MLTDRQNDRMTEQQSDRSTQDDYCNLPAYAHFFVNNDMIQKKDNVACMYKSDSQVLFHHRRHPFGDKVAHHRILLHLTSLA